MMKFKPGDHKDDVRHLFEGHSHVLTEHERRARMNIIFVEKRVMPANPSELDWVGGDAGLRMMMDLAAVPIGVWVADRIVHAPVGAAGARRVGLWFGRLVGSDHREADR